MSTILIEAHAKMISQKERVTEAVNEQNVEANKEILKALKSKDASKVQHILDKYNLEVAPGSTWSSQGYLTLKGPNGKKLCISKDMNHKVGLFNPAGLIAYADTAGKVDYLDYLTGDASNNTQFKGRDNKRYYYDDKSGHTQTGDTTNVTVASYKAAKTNAQSNKDSSLYYQKKINQTQEEINKLTARIQSLWTEVKKYDAKAASELQKAHQILIDTKFKQASKHY